MSDGNRETCKGATDGRAPSPGCGHAAHGPYGCLHRDDDGIPCDCAGDATDDHP